MHFLVTGGLGFIGSHLVEQLLAGGHEITIVDNLSSGRRENVPASDRVKLITKDVLDLDVSDLSSATHGVAHLAAIPSVNSSWTQSRLSHDSNLTATLRMLELCIALKIPRLVLASSAAVYGEPGTTPIAENHSTRPISPYGLQKLASEDYGKLFAGRATFSFVALRLFNVYGPRQVADSPYSGVISRFSDAARTGRPAIIYGDGSQTRDFVYVKDAAAAFDAALSRDSKSKDTLVCNIGTGKATSIQTLAGYMGRFTLSGSLALDRAPILQGDIKQSCADISAARQHLGFEPHYALEKGLSLMFDEGKPA
jgi:UDP-glucose 4-epimerase